MPRKVALTAALAFAAGYVVYAQPSSVVPTPGSVLLLAGHAEPDAQAALKTALTSADADTRAAAARVTASTPVPSLINDLVAALAREKERSVAAQMVGDVLHLAGRNALPLVESQVRRLGPNGAVVLAEWLARVQPSEFIQRMPGFVAVTGARRLAPLVRMAAVQHPDAEDAVLRTWMTVAGESDWGDLLWDLYLGRPFRGAPILMEALNSDRPNIRQESVWFVVNAIARKAALPDTVVAAAAAEPRVAQSSWESVGRAWLRRLRGPSRSDDYSEVLKAEGPKHTPDLVMVDSMPKLTAAEREVLGQMFPIRGVIPRWPRTNPGARLLTPFKPALLAGTLAAAGCETKPDLFGFAVLTYAPDGRPQHIGVDSTRLSAPCLAALTALARTSVAEPDAPAREGLELTLMLPLTAAFARCTADDRYDQTVDMAGSTEGSAASMAPLSAWNITPPTKIKDVRPPYPDAAQRSRIQGVIIVDARISPTGCISSARVLRSIPDLDLAALRGVSEWEYTPTLLNGTAVPVLMTITVNFTLQ